jgi:hypothetical protein
MAWLNRLSGNGMYSMLPFLWYARVASATAWKDSARPVPSLWFWENGVSGIFNLGTGRAESFQAVADATLAYHDVSHVADVDEVALEAVAAFEQFRTFAIIQLGVEVETSTCGSGKTAFPASSTSAPAARNPSRPSPMRPWRVSQIRLGERLVAAFQFVRERDVLDAAFFVVRQGRLRRRRG